MTGLSKSRLLAFRQCPKRLWLSVHRPELADNGGKQGVLNAGNQVGEVARTLYPDGLLIASDRLADALLETQKQITERKRPLFEATFEAQELLVRTDVLLPMQGGYRLIEVKSAASVKDYYYEDIAIQAWTTKAAGVPIKSAEIAHIDTKFVYTGDGNYQGLFKHVAVTDAIADIEPHIPHYIRNAQKTLSAKQPDVDVGDHCSTPFDCPFMDFCSPPSDEETYPISILPYGGALVKQLLEAGYTDLRDVPENLLTKAKHQRVWRASRSGRAELDDEAGNTLRSLGYPRYYMDFETLAPAVPIWADTRPFQQIPFQWSCHIEHSDGGLEHTEFLSTTIEDPRHAFAESLINTLGKSGTIIVYNAAFERARMQELATQFKKLAPAFKVAMERIVDLLPIAREHYYHPQMMGSWSIKAVLPTIAPELAYDGLAVADGGMAQEAFAEIIGVKTTPERKRMLQKELLTYCERDTLAMVKIGKHFENRYLKQPPTATFYV